MRRNSELSQYHDETPRRTVRRLPSHDLERHHSNDIKVARLLDGVENVPTSPYSQASFQYLGLHGASSTPSPTRLVQPGSPHRNVSYPYHGFQRSFNQPVGSTGEMSPCSPFPHAVVSPSHYQSPSPMHVSPALSPSAPPSKPSCATPSSVTYTLSCGPGSISPRGSGLKTPEFYAGMPDASQLCPVDGNFTVPYSSEPFSNPRDQFVYSGGSPSQGCTIHHLGYNTSHRTQSLQNPALSPSSRFLPQSFVALWPQQQADVSNAGVTDLTALQRQVHEQAGLDPRKSVPGNFNANSYHNPQIYDGIALNVSPFTGNQPLSRTNIVSNPPPFSSSMLLPNSPPEMHVPPGHGPQQQAGASDAGVTGSDDKGSKIFKSLQDTTSTSEGSDVNTTQLTSDVKSSINNHTGVPPELDKVLPSLADIKAITKPSKDADLPVDILLLTVTNCEFLACYSELKNPYRCWFDGLGYVYFSDVDESQEELKVALLRCYRNGIGPGGALVSVKNAASVLRPKAVISVGTCSGLNPAKSKLGDVVVSAKLTTYASKVVTNNQEQSTGMRSYVSKRFLDVIKNCADGWHAPLKDLAEAQQVQVYTDAEFLSGPEQVRAEWRRDQLAETSPQAMAIENEGEGVFTAAFDCQIEWLIVKGITDYADGSQLPSESWSSCASVMAASLVAHILSEPCVFRSWPHYQDISEQSSASRSKEQLPSPSDAATAFLEWSQNQLCSFYNSTASQLMITPWDRHNTMDIDDVYVQLTLLRDDRKLAGTTKERLEDYSEIFASHGHHLIPKRILVYGRPGIGKSTLTKKLAVDWSRGNKEILKKFAVVLLIKLRDVGNTQDFCDVLQKAELLSSGDSMVFNQLYDYILRNQQKVLLILDGYDEYSAETSSPVHQIWKGSQLRDCTLLVTTRPRKRDELRPGSHAQFEVNGFDRWQVDTFARKFLRYQTEVLKFTDFLDERYLWGLAEIPLLLLMLVLTWKNYQESLTSHSDLYYKFCQTLLDHVTAKTSDETPRSMDEYKEDLVKLGELAWQALLNDCLYFKLSKVPEDIRLLLEKFIDFGFLQTSNLSDSPHREKLAFFLHKSVQEFLSAWFLVRDLQNAKEPFHSLSKVDSFKRFMELSDVFTFVSELSSEATVAVFSHLKMIGKKEALTEYNFCENPSIDELTKEQERFVRISSDLFFSCPASDRKNVFPSFLQCVNGLLLIEAEQLPKVSSEHCLRSTNFHKPDYVFFTLEYPELFDEEVMNEQLFSVSSDLDTVFVTRYGDVKSINRYYDQQPGNFFIKKVGHRFVCYLTCFQYLPMGLFTSLISAPESSLQEPDHKLQNHDVCNSLQSTEKTSDQTVTHSLSYLREIYFHYIEGDIEGPTSDLVILLNNLHHVPRLSTLVLSAVGMGNQECQLLATALKYVDKLCILELPHNSLGHGISELAKHLHSVPHLEKLDLADTQMGEEEVTDLAHSLQNVTQLSQLFLSNNPLAHGISELAKHLHNAPHLVELSLKDTQMGEEEVTALVRAFVYLPELLFLYLDKNPLGRGVTELIKYLRSNQRLYLYLNMIQLTKKEATELCTLANERPGRGLLTDYYGGYPRRLLTEEELQEKGVTFDEE